MAVLWLHVGTRRTGTTSIQHTCRRSVAVLRDAGLEYPGADWGPHQVSTATRKGGAAEWIEKLPTGCDVLLSSESFGKTTLEQRIALAGLIVPRWSHVRVVMYCREPVSFATSVAQQGVRRRGRPLDVAVRKPIIYHFRDQLEAWIAAFGRESMIVRKFDRRSMIGGDVVDDFFHIIGYAHLLPRLTRVTENVATSLEGLQAIAEHIRKHGPGAGSRHDKTIARLMKMPGTRLTLPPETVREVLARSAGNLAYLEAEFGITFDTPAGSEAPDRTMRRAGGG